MNIFIEFGELGLAGELLVHGVAAGGAAEMGQAGAGDVAVRRIGVADRGQQTPIGIGSGKIDGLAQAVAAHGVGQALAGGRRLHGQVVDAGGIRHEPGLGAFDQRRPVGVPPGSRSVPVS